MGSWFGVECVVDPIFKAKLLSPPGSLRKWPKRRCWWVGIGYRWVASPCGGHLLGLGIETGLLKCFRCLTRKPLRHLRCSSQVHLGEGLGRCLSGCIFLSGPRRFSGAPEVFGQRCCQREGCLELLCQVCTLRDPISSIQKQIYVWIWNGAVMDLCKSLDCLPLCTLDSL